MLFRHHRINVISIDSGADVPVPFGKFPDERGFGQRNVGSGFGKIVFEKTAFRAGITCLDKVSNNIVSFFVLKGWWVPSA